MKNYFGLQWHLTNQCDQRCKHCYIWQKQRAGLKVEPTFVQAQTVIDKFMAFCKEMDVLPFLTITGGDPLLYPSFWEIIGLAKERKIRFNILGNPFHLTLEIAKRLKAAGCLKYQMSLDGLEQTHDYIRKSGSFKATLAGIPILNDAGLGSVIMGTVSATNYQEFPALARLCVEHKASSFVFARYCPTGGDPKFRTIEPKVYRQFLADMWKVYAELKDEGTNFALKDHLWIAFLYEEGLYKLTDDHGAVMDGCHCGINRVSLLPNGDIYACRRCNSRVGNIKRQSFKEIFASGEMDNYRQIERMKGCKDCVLLRYCRGCHAVSAGITGDFFDKDPQCWRS